MAIATVIFFSYWISIADLPDRVFLKVFMTPANAGSKRANAAVQDAACEKNIKVGFN
jgi:hypothetical protein